eukprot:TRINITY_DN2762_c0_g1_i5.p1 TRINITY_DN2762_c0_g1~~TRINITY_DN2762_c0_g1_i5.p1  ORF type:complete len:157 (-),score=21.47 TRINITY_DN2762_c0_g1_i5:210-680(-)
MVSSGAHKFHKGKLAEKIEFNPSLEGKTLSLNDTMALYGLTKLCNLLFAKAWAAKLESEGSHVTCYSIHPGWVATELSRDGGSLVRGLEKIVARTPEEGAIPSLWCACEPLGTTLQNGQYYTWIEEVGEQNKKAKNAELATWLLDWSTKILEKYLD